VRDEHDVFVPAHELPLARGAAHDETADARRDLLLHQRIVHGEIHLAVGKVRGLDGSDQTRRLHLVHALGLGLHRAVGPSLGGDALRRGKKGGLLEQARREKVEREGGRPRRAQGAP